MPSTLPKPVLDEGDFQESIHAAIAAKRHVDYLQGVLKNYEWYKQEFSKIFTDRQPFEGIYTFRAVYLLKKSVWRQFELLGRNTFKEFSEAIIA